VAVILLVLGLGARDAKLLYVDHDDVVAGIDVGGEFGLVLAAQAPRDFRREPPQDLVRGVHDVPVTTDLFRLGREGLHGDFLAIYATLDAGRRPPVEATSDRYFGRFVWGTANPKL
jgi:hypothetical protein